MIQALKGYNHILQKMETYNLFQKLTWVQRQEFNKRENKNLCYIQEQILGEWLES